MGWRPDSRRPPGAPGRSGSRASPHAGASWRRRARLATVRGPMTTPPEPLPPARGLTQRDVIASWAPLAGSWLLMGLELPAVSAVMARLPHATVSLAAYGGVVFPLALLIESPIIMLLSASTALSRDQASYRLLRRCMLAMAGALTVLHALVAFTPLFEMVVRHLLGAPSEIL